MGKIIDPSKKIRHEVMEDSMNDVIKQHTGAPIGPVDLDEIAALQRKIGVETNAAGEAFTPGELITAAGIVMEETGAYYHPTAGFDDKSDMKARLKQRRSTSYFFFGDGRWKGKG